MKGLQEEKMDLWFIGELKLKPMDHYMIVILKAFPLILDKGLQVRPFLVKFI